MSPPAGWRGRSSSRASADGVIIATGELMFGRVRLVLDPEDRDKLADHGVSEQGR